MPRKTNKRRLRVQLTFIYTIMVFAVLAIVTVLVLVLQGYRFNQYDGRLEQGGLVQFDSQPSGAVVSVDGMSLSNKTASKIILSAGSHSVEMTKKGYTTWKKDVLVKPGSVLWLNYTLLFPLSPTVSTAMKYTAVSSALPSPDQRVMAVIADAANPEIILTTLNTDNPATTTINIPLAAYTQSTSGVPQSFALVSWDKDSNLLIVRHDVNGKVEYLSVDTRDTTRTVNVSAGLGIDIASVSYALNDSNTLYVLSNTHELRRANISSMTLTGPLASDVSHFIVTEPHTVVYETLPDANDQRVVGYISSDSNKAKVLSSYSGLNGATLLATSGSYYGQHYVAILHDTTLDILQGDLPSSDSNAILSLKPVVTLEIADGGDYLGFSPDDDRLIYVAKGTHIVTYDLELDTSATTTLQAPLTRDAQWLDGYHILSTDTNGYYYDYDGTNGQLFAQNTLDLPGSLGSGGKYLYYFTKTTDSTLLNRVQLVN